MSCEVLLASQVIRMRMRYEEVLFFIRMLGDIVEAFLRICSCIKYKNMSIIFYGKPVNSEVAK